ncbi:MAG: hypothetical protein MOGMAGMI_02310 [Candidatus Omnitrophica bacterium]|nr:hypothetical protein [Candidatus Omnitrophota bacterium]
MTYLQLLNIIVDDGIKAARRDYKGKAPRLKGAVDGFQACREKSIVELWNTVLEARTCVHKAEEAYTDGSGSPADVWYWRCYAGEVEWTFDCMNYAMQSSHQIHLRRPVPARCALKVQDIFSKERAMAEGYTGPTPRKPGPSPDLNCPECKTTTIRYDRKLRSWVCQVCPWTEKAKTS